MRPRLDDKIKQHLQPARVQAESKGTLMYAFVDSEPDGSRMWEQLWTVRIAEGHYELRCIPFYAYGLALEDVVVCDENYVLTKVIYPSRQKTFRIKFRDVQWDRRMEILRGLEALECIWEFYNEEFLGVSCPEISFPAVFDFLYDFESAGDLVYETANFKEQTYVLPGA